LKEIGILEIYCHVKFLYTLSRICKTEKSNVTIFTTKEIFLKMETYLENKSDYNIVLKKENESKHSFVKRVEKICNEKIDLLFVNTIQTTCLNFPHFFGFKPKCKMILTIHTANAWFDTKPVFSIKKIFRTIDTNLSTIIIHTIVLPKYNAINVIYSPIKDYILKKTNYKKNVFTFPFGFFNDKIDISASKKNDKLIIVVPGQIEEHRRDYNVVLDAFENLFKKFNKEIMLYLLGYPVGIYGNFILKRCKKFKDRGFNIKYYDSFVPEDEYNEIMKDVDLIITPIRIKSRGAGVITETYGETKGSAAVFEVIQYAKPSIVPEKFNLLKELDTSTLKYKNRKDLEKILIELIESKDKLEKLKQEAYKNSKKFTINVFQDYFFKEILNNLDNL
jgi:hypothetical protein